MLTVRCRSWEFSTVGMYEEIPKVGHLSLILENVMRCSHSRGCSICSNTISRSFPVINSSKCSYFVNKEKVLVA